MRRSRAFEALWALGFALLVAGRALAQAPAPPAQTPAPAEEAPPAPAAPPAEPAGPTPLAPAPLPSTPAQEPAPPTVPSSAAQPPAPTPAPAALPLGTAPPPEPLAEPAPPASSSPATAQIDSAPPATDGEAEEEKLAWRNTQLIWDHAVAPRTFDRSAQLTYNPTYVQTLSARPRWYLSDSLYARLRQDMELELTESDSTVEEQQVLLLDTELDVVEGNLWSYEDTKLRVGANLFLPTSLASQAASRIFGLGALVGLSRELPVAEGLTLDLSGAYRHYFASSNVASTDKQYFCQLAGRDLAGPCDQAGGATRVVDRFDATLEASIAVIEQLSFGMGFGGLWQRGAGLAAAEIDLDGDGRTDLTLDDTSDTHWRNLTNTYVYASYAPVDWLSTDLTLYTITGQIDPDGTRRNPFYGPDTMLSLSFTVSIDELYLAASGGARRSGGNSAAGARLP